ncbi:PAS domain S-box [Candidatus Halobonum tyrrellensis G22]|uniref:histidine kinase n=1 Tax=Candidatus Halobonum tyrrellensis G22 TaxID=1324957 RepID=V4GX63_9EURY|nr:PAS domain S-box [Candidatus Halobonum tyrrellensis G22]
MEDIWGVDADALRSDVSRLMDGVHSEDRDRVLQAIGGAAEDRTDASVEHRVVRPDGAIRWVHARIVSMSDDGDQIDLVGVTTDITDQKRRQQEWEVLNRIVRHDIRNDMAVILGWAEMLDGYVTPEGEEYLRKILTSGEHVVELTAIARDYVETLSTDGAVAVEPTSLRSVVETELSLQEESFPRAEFQWDDLPDVAVAANGMLGSVFRNLLANAVRHNDHDTPTVRVRCDVSDDDVVVRVADNGPGVPDSRTEEVFGRGQHGLDSSGTGIGLYLVETLVDQYGGEVWIENNDLGGATFAVRLQRAD